jgi:hypothetical protein
VAVIRALLRSSRLWLIRQEIAVCRDCGSLDRINSIVCVRHRAALDRIDR